MASGSGRRGSSPGVASGRVGDNIARILRARILNNAFPNGLLPKQDDLTAEFEVSAPSVREAFRILEAEGLITVRRGNVGGAVVHVPDASSTAHALGLALESDAVTLADVSAALCALDACAVAACAGRADRLTEVVPRLMMRVDEANAAINSADWWALSLRFHEDIAELSGNRTFKLLIRSLFSLWQTHADEWLDVLGHEKYVSRRRRQQMTASHRQLVSLIAAGDPAAAATAAQQHMSVSHRALLGRPDTMVSVTRVTRAGSGTARTR